MSDPQGTVHTAEKYQVNIAAGAVVGTVVIGDHNTVGGAKAGFPTPREAPVLRDRVVGRDELLSSLAPLLTEGPAPRIAALCGMGGIGKSTLAALYAGSDAAREAFPDGNFWVDLREGDPMAALARMAQACGHPVDSYTTIGARSRVVRSLLAQRRVLIVADDPRAEEEVLAFLPAHSESALLVTTRDETLASALTGRLLRVDRLEHVAGVELLALLADGGPHPGAGDALPGLVEDLGGLPLALELVGKQARKEAGRPGFSWTALRARYTDAAQRLGLERAERGVRTAFEQTWGEALSSDGRVRFALLGIFPGAELLTGEIAAAWDATDDVARSGIGELLDLSLLRQVDAVTVRLHPLLQDFAAEKAEDVPVDVRRAAHLRVSDYHFGRAPAEPESWQEIQPVLSAHVHACAAGDRERARRVFPWFGRVPVPGFLIDRGFLSARVHHLSLDLELARSEGPVHEAYARYALGDALGQAGRLTESVDQLRRALALIDGLPDPSVPVVTAARGKFSYRLGQVLVDLGEMEAALAAYETALADDLSMGQEAHAAITMLQMADLWIKRGVPDGVAKALELCQAARKLARDSGHPEAELMTLARLADLEKHDDPHAALEHVWAALRLDEPGSPAESAAAAAGRVASPAFASRQGARYAVSLGRIAAGISLSVPAALEAAVRAYGIAMQRADAANARVQSAEASYWLGYLFEHLDFHHGHAAEIPAAAACYARSHALIKEMESPPDIQPRQRLERNVLPRLDPALGEAFAAGGTPVPLEEAEAAINRVRARVAALAGQG